MIKRVAKAITDRTLVDLVAYIRRQLPPAPGVNVNQPQLVAETQRRAIVQSADYADEKMASALCFGDIQSLWRHAFGLRTKPGLIVEFGVWKATSTNFFASLTEEVIFGFDSFEGLREDWSGWGYAKGHFNLSGNLPTVAANVQLIKGWFDATLGGFLAKHPEPWSFVHVDCDTYEATTTILDLSADRIVSGTVVLFDEYFGYRGWRMGEFKAWQEFVSRQGLQYEYRAFSDQAVAVTVR